MRQDALVGMELPAVLQGNGVDPALFVGQLHAVADAEWSAAGCRTVGCRAVGFAHWCDPFLNALWML